MDPPKIMVDGEDNPGFQGEATSAPIDSSMFLQVDQSEANTHTYIYEPEKSLQRMTIEAFPSEQNYEKLSDLYEGPGARPTLDELLEGKKAKDPNQVESQDDNLQGKVIKFGWVEGVLMRCLLNIWGTMLFLRLTWVIGQAGIWQGLVIISLCNVVTVLTSMSMSAVATNGQIAAGGVYYMISRALGPALGGSIGLMFTIANTISVATYTIGFSESLLDFLQDVVPGWNGIVTPVDKCPVAGCRPNDVRIVGGPTLCLFLFIAFAGMDWVTRIQKSLLMLLLAAQVDMLIGSFLDIEWGSAYVNKIENGSYFNVDHDQRHAFGYTGWSVETAKENLGPQYIAGPISDDKTPGFMDLYGVFFTAVTGIVAGANLSGDLRDPADAIPKGTLLAIALTYVTYMLFGVTTGFVFRPQASGIKEEYIFYRDNTTWPDNWVGEFNSTFGYNYSLPSHLDCTPEANAFRDYMKAEQDNGHFLWYDSNDQWTIGKGCSYGAAMDQMTMTYISFTGYLRYAGGFSASLSSAIASLVGAPRVLQAVGVDKIYPGVFFFAKGGNANNDPWRGYILVFIIAMALTMIASLNEVGIIASNFFLAAYALINLSCFYSSVTKEPSWRPAYKWYNPWVSLFSAGLCVAIMFVMSWIYATATVCVLLLLGIYILYMNPEANWGAPTQGQALVRAIKAAHDLTNTPEHVKNYRPKVLVLTGNPAHRPPLVNFANLITKDTSLLVFGHVLNDMRNINLNSLRQNVQMWLKDNGISGFYQVIQNQNYEEGSRAILSLSGFGKLAPNMLLCGFKQNWALDKAGAEHYLNTLFMAFDSQMSVGILRVRKGFDYSNVIGSTQVVRTEVKKLNPKSKEGSDEEVDEKGKDEGIKKRRISIFRGQDGKTLDSSRVAAIQQFKAKKYTGFIDVWWLYDDGGLTLLLPHILTMRNQFKEAKLRVFTLGNKAADFDKETRNLATLLAKFRIEYGDVIVVPDVMKKAEPETKAVFDRMIDGLGIDESELRTEREKTNRHLRLHELLQTYSIDADLIVMTMPLPRRGQSVPLYMAWLDMISKDLPPTLFIRGNQQSVLTFYS